MATGAGLTCQTNATALQMANAIFGDGVAVTGASCSGPTHCKAIYANGQLSPGVVPSTTGVILSTGAGYGPAARRTLRGVKAQVLFAQGWAA